MDLVSAVGTRCCLSLSLNADEVCLLHCTQMKPFWSATPSQAERTHEWDVSGTNWDLYPRGKFLTSPVFSCGGLHCLTTRFHPKGSEQQGWLFIESALKPEVMVELQFRIESKRSQTNCGNFCLDMSLPNGNLCALIPHFKGVVGVDKISVTVTCVKHKHEPEDVQQVPCIEGCVLRVVKDSTTAKESFFVVGCNHFFREQTHASFLGQIGKVVAVGRCSILLEHHDGTLLWWGHRALLPGVFTSLEVDAMKVSAAQTVRSGDLIVQCKSNVCCTC